MIYVECLNVLMHILNVNWNWYALTGAHCASKKGARKGNIRNLFIQLVQSNSTGCQCLVSTNCSSSRNSLPSNRSFIHTYIWACCTYRQREQNTHIIIDFVCKFWVVNVETINVFMATCAQQLKQSSFACMLCCLVFVDLFVPFGCLTHTQFLNGTFTHFIFIIGLTFFHRTQTTDCERVSKIVRFEN